MNAKGPPHPQPLLSTRRRARAPALHVTRAPPGAAAAGQATSVPAVLRPGVQPSPLQDPSSGPRHTVPAPGHPASGSRARHLEAVNCSKEGTPAPRPHSRCPRCSSRKPPCLQTPPTWATGCAHRVTNSPHDRLSGRWPQHDPKGDIREGRTPGRTEGAGVWSRTGVGGGCHGTALGTEGRRPQLGAWPQGPCLGSTPGSWHNHAPGSKQQLGWGIQLAHQVTHRACARVLRQGRGGMQ